MTSVAYAMHDHATANDVRGAISVPADAGGCGETHTAQINDRGHVFYECDLCAPYAIGHMYGFSSRPSDVPLTPDELADRELAARDADLAKNSIMAEYVAARMVEQRERSALQAAAPSTADVLAKASPEQLLAALPPEMRAVLEAAAGQAAAEPEPEPAAVKPRTPRTRKAA